MLREFFLLGQIRNSKDPSTRPFPAYYLVAYLVKEPIALEILFMAGLGLLWARSGWREFFARESFLLFPAILIFLVFSLVQPRPDRDPSYPALPGAGAAHRRIVLRALGRDAVAMARGIGAAGRLRGRLRPLVRAAPDPLHE